MLEESGRKLKDAEGPGARRSADSAWAASGAPCDGREPEHDGGTRGRHVVAGGGWQIRRVADTASREQGFDVLAEKAGRTLAVEVKGYPSRSYADSRRMGEMKPTNQATQARHLFAGALLKAMLTRDEHPAVEVAIALPDVQTYRSLYQRTAASLALLQIEVLLVALDGTVTVAAPDGRSAGQPG